MYDYNKKKSNEKQRLKSKKQIQPGVKIGSFLLHRSHCSSVNTHLEELSHTFTFKMSRMARSLPCLQLSQVHL